MSKLGRLAPFVVLAILITYLRRGKCVPITDDRKDYDANQGGLIEEKPPADLCVLPDSDDTGK